MRWILFILLFLQMNLYTFAHDYFYSISEIFYNTETKKMELIIKVHSHDLEHVFEDNTDCNKTIKNGTFTTESDKCLENYFSNNFILSNKKNRSILIHLIGKEQLEDGNMFLYFETDVFKKKEIKITNTIFLDINKHQKNIIHFKKDKNKEDFKSIYLSNKNSKTTFTL